MSNRLQILVLTGLLSLVAMPVLGAEIESRGSGGIKETRETRETRGQREVGTNQVTSLRQGEAANLLAQGVTRVTGVEIIQTELGLELILETVAGSERLVPLIVPEGNDLVIDILDATLAFSIRNGVSELNPAPGISRVTINKNSENSVRVRISGANQTPSAEVVTGRENLVLSVTPDGTMAEPPFEGKQETEGEIEVIARGEAEDEDDYLVPDASSTLRTDISIRDTPASVQVIPQQVIEDQGTTNVREIVRNASGVNFETSVGGRGEQFIIRGFRAERFRNGFRDGFSSSRTQTELANIDRVEILKGPASILFGRVEPSGIINFVTKQPLREPFYEIAFTAGNFDFFRPTLDFSGPLTDNGNVAYRLNVAYENAGSFRDSVDTERFLVAPTLSWQIGDDTELSLEFSYLDDSRPRDRGLVVLSDNEVADIPFSSFLGDPEAQEDFEETRTELYLDHRFNENLSLSSVLRYTTANQDGDTSEIVAESGDDRNFFVGTGRNEQSYETLTFQNDLVAKFNTGLIEHTLLFGLEYATESSEFESEDSPEFPTIDIFNPSAFEPPTAPFELSFDQDTDDESFGIYVQNQIAILDNLQILLGGRFDTFNSEIMDNLADGEITETEADAFSPRVGIVYQPIEPVSLYASFSRSFTPVSGTDINNEPFESQRGTGFEIGVKTEIIKDRLSSTLALYDTTLTNILTEDPNDSDFSVQTGEQNSQGIELDLTGEILPGWNIFAGYAYTDAEVTEDNVIPVGNRLNNVPEHNFNLWTTYTIQKGSLAGLGFGAGVFHISERAGDLDNSFFIDGYTRVDAAIYYEKDKYRAALNFKNLFDAEFIESAENRRRIAPGAPFTVQGTVSVDF